MCAPERHLTTPAAQLTDTRFLALVVLALGLVADGFLLQTLIQADGPAFVRAIELSVVGALVFLLWLLVAYWNLEPLGDMHDRVFGRGWAVAGVLVPGAILLLLPALLYTLLEASAPERSAARRAPAALLVALAGWALLVGVPLYAARSDGAISLKPAIAAYLRMREWQRDQQRLLVEPHWAGRMPPPKLYDNDIGGMPTLYLSLATTAFLAGYAFAVSHLQLLRHREREATRPRPIAPPAPAEPRPLPAPYASFTPVQEAPPAGPSPAKEAAARADPIPSVDSRPSASVTKSSPVARAPASPARVAVSAGLGACALGGLVLVAVFAPATPTTPRSEPKIPDGRPLPDQVVAPSTKPFEAPRGSAQAELPVLTPGAESPPDEPAWGGPRSSDWKPTAVSAPAAVSGSLPLLDARGGLLSMESPGGIVLHRDAEGQGQRLDLGRGVEELHLTPDRALVTRVNGGGEVVVIDTRKGVVLRRMSGDAACFDLADPRRGYAVSHVELLYLDLATGKTIRKVEFRRGIGSRIVARGRFLYGTDAVNGYVVVVDLSKGTVVSSERVGSRSSRLQLAVPAANGTVLTGAGAFREGFTGQIAPLTHVLVGELPAGQLLARGPQWTFELLDPTNLERLAEVPSPEGHSLQLVVGTSRLLAVPWSGGPIQYRDLEATPLPPRQRAQTVHMAAALEPWTQPLRFDGIPPGDLEVTVARPAGVTFDRATGELRWTPALAQVGPQVIQGEVTAPAAARGPIELAVTVHFRELAPEYVARLVRLDADHAAGWSQGKPATGVCRIALQDGTLEETPIDYIQGSAWDGRTLCLVSPAGLCLVRTGRPDIQLWLPHLDLEPESLTLHPGGEVSWLRDTGDGVEVRRLDPATGRLRGVHLVRPAGDSRSNALRWLDAERFVSRETVYSWGANVQPTTEPPPPPAGHASGGLVDGSVRVTLRRTTGALLAAFVAATDGRPLGSATFAVEAADDVEARALLFHKHRTLLVPLASGRLALLRYDPSTWDRPPP